MAPFITNDLNPTPPKTGGDDHFEPAVMRGAGVVYKKFVVLLYKHLVHTKANTLQTQVGVLIRAKELSGPLHHDSF
jgi:hypothetical protein